MKIKDFKKGQIIAIQGTKSYPKLKLEEGYIDIRDEIVNKGNLDFEAVEMSRREVLKQPAFEGATAKDLDDWIEANINR